MKYACFLSHIIFSCVACLSLPRIFHVNPYHKWENHQKKRYLLTKSCIIITSITFVENISARYYRKFTYLFVQNTRYSRQNLSRHELPREIFEKLLKYQIFFTFFQRKTSFSMRTDRRTGSNNKSASRFWQFCARPKKEAKTPTLLCFHTFSNVLILLLAHFPYNQATRFTLASEETFPIFDFVSTCMCWDQNSSCLELLLDMTTLTKVMADVFPQRALKFWACHVRIICEIKLNEWSMNFWNNK